VGCAKTPPDARDELLRAVSDPQAKDYDFQLTEDADTRMAALTNPALQDFVYLDRGAPEMVLQYTRTTDRKSGATRTYRTEVRQDGAALLLLATDIDSNEVVLKNPFPHSTSPDAGISFDGTFFSRPVAVKRNEARRSRGNKVSTDCLNST